VFPAAPTASATSKRIVAAFDFDGTLSHGVCGMRFYRELLGPARMTWVCVRHFSNFIGYSLRYNHETSLERISAHIFRGRRAEDVIRAGERFSARTVPRFLLPVGMARLRHHLAAGHTCVIVSRAYAWSIEPWARQIGVHAVLATKLETGPDGILTGRLVAPSCDGEHKRLRLLAWLGPDQDWELYAYGDSPGDYAMLGAAQHPFLRTGDKFSPWRP
jgi:phosphatidylglycerophosphatase C